MSANGDCSFCEEEAIYRWGELSLCDDCGHLFGFDQAEGTIVILEV